MGLIIQNSVDAEFRPRLLVAAVAGFFSGLLWLTVAFKVSLKKTRVLWAGKEAKLFFLHNQV
jgi:hypothetical protein